MLDFIPRPMPKTDKRAEPNHNVTRILAVLLILQAVLFFYLGVQYFYLNQRAHIGPFWFYAQNQPALTWENIGVYLSGIIEFALESNLVSALLESVALFMLAILIFIAGIGFFRLWRFSWDMAIFVQGVSLLLALILYYTSKPNHMYTLMAVSIGMVIYLSYANVRVLFLPEDRRVLKEEESR